MDAQVQSSLLLQFADRLRSRGDVERWGHRPLPAVAMMGFWILVCLFATGCKTSGDNSSLVMREPPRPRIDGIKGPNERKLTSWWRKEKKEDDDNTLKPIAGTEEYLAAEKLYEAGDYAAAEKKLRWVSWKFKKSEIREDAIFLRAEANYKMEKYYAANDLYGDLLREFPSTRHLDTTTKRLFEIARIWLDYPELSRLEEIQQVNYDEPSRPLPPPEPRKEKVPNPLTPNLTDKKRPYFDPEGNAIASLRAIWLNDPTGPLADDALMLSASHYARRGNWVEADRYFSMLREEYPNSVHAQDAFVQGSHVKLMSYEGPAYEGKQLDEAAQLKKSTLRLYPEAAERDRLQSELNRIEELRAAREWDNVVFYRRKGLKPATAIHAHLLLARFPDSKFAEKARDVLRELGPEYADGSKFAIAPPPAREGLLPPIPLPSLPSAKPIMRQPQPAEQDPELEPAPSANPGRSWNPFRKKPSAPKSSTGDDAELPEEEDDSAAPPATEQVGGRRESR